jgi:putative oxidoreductase
MNDLQANDLQDIAALVGRTLLGLLFVVSGIEKIGAFADTMNFMASAGLPAVKVLLLLAIIVEIGGGGAICFGWRTRLAALVVLLFTVIVTMVFHRFWIAPPDQVAVQRLLFMKNVSIMGGLVMLAAFGPGNLAFAFGRRRDG